VSSYVIVVTNISIVEGSICRTDIYEQTEEGVEIDSKPRCG
jgi:Zn-finger nucleic acid-binding protein